MCLVAEGASDVYYTFGVYCWDVAAGYVICREAGAVVLDTAGIHCVLPPLLLSCSNFSCADVTVLKVPKLPNGRLSSSLHSTHTLAYTLHT